MKVKYFEDTDTLHIVFRSDVPTQTKDLDENTLLDTNAAGQLCSITIEHAKERVGAPEVEYEAIHG